MYVPLPIFHDTSYDNDVILSTAPAVENIDMQVSLFRFGAPLVLLSAYERSLCPSTFYGASSHVGHRGVGQSSCSVFSSLFFATPPTQLSLIHVIIELIVWVYFVVVRFGMQLRVTRRHTHALLYQYSLVN